MSVSDKYPKLTRQFFLLDEIQKALSNHPMYDRLVNFELLIKRSILLLEIVLPPNNTLKNLKNLKNLENLKILK